MAKKRKLAKNVVKDKNPAIIKTHYFMLPVE
jgi:hypothetical protein